MSDKIFNKLEQLNKKHEHQNYRQRRYGWELAFMILATVILLTALFLAAHF